MAKNYEFMDTGDDNLNEFLKQNFVKVEEWGDEIAVRSQAIYKCSVLVAAKLKEIRSAPFAYYLMHEYLHIIMTYITMNDEEKFKHFLSTLYRRWFTELCNKNKERFVANHQQN